MVQAVIGDLRTDRDQLAGEPALTLGGQDAGEGEGTASSASLPPADPLRPL